MPFTPLSRPPDGAALLCCTTIDGGPQTQTVRIEAVWRYRCYFLCPPGVDPRPRWAKKSRPRAIGLKGGEAAAAAAGAENGSGADGDASEPDDAAAPDTSRLGIIALK
jgi:hypothetical protein